MRFVNHQHHSEIQAKYGFSFQGLCEERDYNELERPLTTGEKFFEAITVIAFCAIAFCAVVGLVSH